MGRNLGAAMTLDVEKLTSLSKEARQAVAEALDALEEWRVEIGAANERCLQKVCDQVTNAHRTLGWTEQASSAAKEHLLKASNLQLQMIEHTMQLWQQQLKTPPPNDPELVRTQEGGSERLIKTPSRHPRSTLWIARRYTTSDPRPDMFPSWGRVGRRMTPLQPLRRISRREVQACSR
jgi:hypothetical protein